MPAEFEFYGLYLPRLMVLMLLSFVLLVVVRRSFALMRLYSIVWHRSLFDLCVYVLLLGALSSLAQWYFA